MLQESSLAVRYEKSDHIATLTIDREEALNALDLATWHAFSAATQRLEADDDVWVGIVTGAGDRAFCAGADLRDTIPRLLQHPDTDPYPEPPTIMYGQDVSKPLIAAVNGYALGGGFEVVLGCDIRIASTTARFASSEVAWGLMAGWGASQRLPRELPRAIAAEILFAGEQFDAQQALEWGVVNRVVPPEELMAEARRFAETICQRAPLAVRATKRAMLAAYSLPLDEGIEFEHRLFKSTAQTKDLREGLAAFEERRTPRFRGE
jgi:enoyl-CoA hydratase/carnithine racemase